MGDQGKLIGGLVGGAGLMYLLDPDRGARRRALVRDQATRAWHKLGDGFEATAHDLGNRAKGTAAELRGGRGVSEVLNEPEVQREPGDVSSPRGGRPREALPEPAQENWAPGTRVLMGAVGGILAYQGLRSRGPGGPVIATVGAGLLIGGLTNRPAKRLTGIGPGRRAIEVQKVIDVAAPIDRVWELWSNYENFPRFMAHLTEVQRTGEGRSHWVAVGPAGKRIEWDVITTVALPKEVIAWTSVEGSEVENAGIVRFRPNPDGTTRIDVRLSYNPPGGAVDHAIATLFGVDPKRAMNEDMVRFQSLLEEGKTSTGEGEVRLEEGSTGATGGRKASRRKIAKRGDASS